MSNIEGEGIRLLHVDPHLCVVWKPAGVPVQPDPTGDPSLLELVGAELKDHSIALVHRLDRPVSGAVIFARGPKVLADLSSMFRERLVAKTYWAIVEGRPQVGGSGVQLLEHVLEHDGRARRSKVLAVGNGPVARLHFRVLAQGDRYALLEVWPEGGAFHQIRAQLAAAGHNIKGDVKYGARRGGADRSIALHARSIAFRHPVTGQSMLVEAPAPAGPLWDAFLELAGLPR